MDDPVTALPFEQFAKFVEMESVLAKTNRPRFTVKSKNDLPLDSLPFCVLRLDLIERCNRCHVPILPSSGDEHSLS